MKKLLFIIVTLYSIQFISCSPSKDNDGFLFYVNIKSEDTLAWTTDFQTKDISEKEYNSLELNTLDTSCCYKLSKESEDKAYTVITLTDWTFDSIASIDEMTNNRENWFWFTKSTMVENTNMYTIGSINFQPTYKTQLIVLNNNNTDYKQVSLYGINVLNNRIVSATRLGEYTKNISMSYTEFAHYNSRKQEFIIKSIREESFHGETHKSTSSAHFTLSEYGKVIWNPNLSN